jgi:hypothetical protein
MKLTTEAIYKVGVSGNPSDLEDEDVPGTYLIALPLDYPESAVVTTILDTFHGKIGISELDDFTITVTDEAGNLMFETSDDEVVLDPSAARFLGKSSS